MTELLDSLEASAERLERLVTPLGDEMVAASAYPTEWSIADVLSHLGSGAEIWARRIDDVLADVETPDGFAPSVWRRWDAKSPREKADDGLASQRSFVDRLRAVPSADRVRFSMNMGPLDLDWDTFLGLRMNEQLLHEWDVVVALDQNTTLAADGVGHVVDNLAMVASWTAKPVGEHREIVVVTRDPERSFRIDVQPEAVGFYAGDPADVPAEPTLSMPAEAFVRLVYGRLDPDHTPSSVTGDTGALGQLRAVFPGP